jgi:Do/DeqQ family serine protease
MNILPYLAIQSNKNKTLIPLTFFLWVFCLAGWGHAQTGLDSRHQSPVVRAVQKISPAVVNISSEYEVANRNLPFSGFGMDPFFESFFKDFFDQGSEQRRKRTSLGSGVIIDGSRGLILTNTHVIEKTIKIKVTLNDEREFEAEIVGSDPDTDLAVLRIDTRKPLPAVAMGNSDDLMIGETVIAIGNPFGFSNTVTTGVVSAVNRSIRTGDRVYHDFIQTDASINPGNSGGPLLNINGDLIGINTAIYAKAQGIGFAIPINTAKRIVADLIQFGEVIPAWIGVTVQDVDEKLAHYLGIEKTKGAIIIDVEAESPAADAGITEGDLLVSIGSRSVGSSLDYQTLMRGYAAGDSLEIGLIRNNQKRVVKLKARVFPEKRALDLAFRLMGIRVEDIKFKKQAGSRGLATEGVMISDIAPRSPLARIGARSGDIIRQLDEIKIRNLNDFKKAIVKYRLKSSVIVLLQRGDQGYYVSVRL